MRCERDVVRFYKRVLGSRPVRRKVGAVVLVVGVGVGAFVGDGAGRGAGIVVWLMVVAALVVWDARCGEVLKTGGLRWTHRDRGWVEIELLGGGRTWRRDLREVAARLLEMEWSEWRLLKVMMVTAVFPVRWLRCWGFEIRDCGRGTQLGYRVVYGGKWLEWWLGSVLRGQERPRWRRRVCVRATHSMGRWMEVVSQLPKGLR